MCAWLQVSECASARCQLCPITINNLPSIFWKVVKLFVIFTNTKPELIIKNYSIHLLPPKKGAQQLCDVIKDMTGVMPSRFFKLCWCYLTPLFSLVSLNLFLSCLFCMRIMQVRSKIIKCLFSRPLLYVLWFGTTLWPLIGHTYTRTGHMYLDGDWLFPLSF